MPLSNLALVSAAQGLPQSAPLNCKDTGGICIGARLLCARQSQPDWDPANRR